MARIRKRTRRYSVYEAGTDRPLRIWGTSVECAAAMGIALHTFYNYVKLSRNGHPVEKYEIIVHTEAEEEEDFLL